MIPNIEIYTGPMMSGKSDALIDCYKNLTAKQLAVAAIQSKTNSRDNGMIASRTGQCIRASKLDSVLEINCHEGFDAYIIDEFQFFPEPDDGVKHIVSLARDFGKTIIIGTLDYDYRGQKWEAYDLLNSLEQNSDLHVRTSQLTAWCDGDACDSEARFTALLNNGVQVFEGEQVVIDGPEAHYSPRCDDHFEALKMNPQPTP